MLADAVIGDTTRFDVMQSLNHLPFPGGPLRTPALALGMAYYKLRDRLKL
jgi:gamma-glutamylputrescine oxidase